MGCGIFSSYKTGFRMRKIVNSCNWNQRDAEYLGQTLTRCGTLRAPNGASTRIPMLRQGKLVQINRGLNIVLSSNLYGPAVPIEIETNHTDFN